MIDHHTRFLRKPDVLAITGLSAGTIDNLEAAGTFPKRIAIAPRLVGWVASEVEEWAQKRIEESRTNAQVALDARKRRDPNGWMPRSPASRRQNIAA